MDIVVERKVLPVNNNFVFKGIREIGSGNGNGESRLHIGSRRTKEEVESFFGGFSTENQYYFVRGNLKEYMQSVKFEYIYQGFQKYKGISKEYWQEQFDTLNTVDNFSFTCKYHKIDTNGKMYASFKGEIFDLIRHFALPGITELIIEKNDLKYKFLLKFKEDITDLKLDLPAITDFIFDLSPEYNEDNERQDELKVEEMPNNFFICKLNKSISLGRKINLPILKESMNFQVVENDIVWFCFEENNVTYLDSASIVEEIADSEREIVITVVVHKKVTPLSINNLRDKGILTMDLTSLINDNSEISADNQQESVLNDSETKDVIDDGERQQLV